MGMFESLLKLRDSAEVINANVQEFLDRFRKKPTFFANSGSEVFRRGQRRASARDQLTHAEGDIRHIRKHLECIESADYFPELGLLRSVTALKVSPVSACGLSYPTAHEGAIAMGEEIINLWDGVGADDAIEHSPTRLHSDDEQNPDKDLAIETMLLIRKKLRRKLDQFPPCLYGQLEQEFEAAANLLDWDTEHGDKPAANKADAMPLKDKATEARGKYIYEQCCKGTAYKAIIAYVRNKKTWANITTKPGIINAAKRYADRHSLPHPKKRTAPPRVSARRANKR